MKKIIILIVLGFTLSGMSAQEINWITLEEAVKLQKKNPRKIIMDMYTVWCGPCKRLDRDTFGNKDVINYINKYYYAIKFNAEGNEKVNYKGKTYTNPNYDPARAKSRNYQHQLAQHFGVRSYPTMIFIDENLEFLSPIGGYRNPQQLELFLKLFKEDLHKELTTQEAYNEFYETFKPEFKNTY